MSGIHPTAILGAKVNLGRNVSVGPYTVIEDEVSVGDETTVLSHVFIGKGTIIGRHNFIHMGSVIGHEAQHKQSKGVHSFLTVGDHNVFREYTTVHRGSTDGSHTRVGDHNYFMAFSHVGHDSQIKNHVIMTNSSLVGGHVQLEDHCVLGGASAVHQFCHVGTYAMVGGLASITKDLPPYMLVDDNEDLVGSVNIVGLRRAGFSEEVKRDIKNAYKLLYLSGLNLTHAMDAILKQCHSKEVADLIEFMKETKRGILGHRRQHSF